MPFSKLTARRESDLVQSTLIIQPNVGFKEYIHKAENQEI